MLLVKASHRAILGSRNRERESTPPVDGRGCKALWSFNKLVHTVNMWDVVHADFAEEYLRFFWDLQFPLAEWGSTGL